MRLYTVYSIYIYTHYIYLMFLFWPHTVRVQAPEPIWLAVPTFGWQRAVEDLLLPHHEPLGTRPHLSKGLRVSLAVVNVHMNSVSDQLEHDSFLQLRQLALTY